MAKGSNHTLLFLGLGAVILGGGYFLYSEKEAYKSIKTSVQGVAIVFKNSNLVITTTINLINPSTKTLNLKGLYAKLYINKYLFGDINSVKAAVINPSATTQIVLTSSIPESSIDSALVALIKSGGKTFTGIMDGYIDIGFAKPVVTYQFPLTLKKIESLVI